MLKIDGKEVAAEGKLLERCREVGADVPAFCADDDLGRGGHCRGCMVEVDGRFVAACTTDARDGMEVRTDTEALTTYREDLAELMIAESRPGGSVGETLVALGAKGERYPRTQRASAKEKEHPYLRIDLEKCISCRLCERACAELQGQFVYAFEGRGAQTQLTWGASLTEGGCVSCGACVAVCPSEAIVDIDLLKTEEITHSVRTTCGYCGVGCQLEVHASDDDVIRIEGVRSSPVNAGHACLKGRYAHRFVRHPDRLTQPLVRENGELRPASWEEALARIAEAFGDMPVAGLSSSRCSNEENYLVQKWMRAGLGTHDVDCCARVCHAPTATGMKAAFGTGAATNSLADLALADVIIVAGSNTTESHPVTGARIRQEALRGARLVVIDPRRTEMAALADVHLQLRPGTNVPLLNSLAHVLVKEGHIDRVFIEARTEGFAELEQFLEDFSPEKMEAITGVPADDVRRAARLYGTAEHPLQVHGLGMTEHHQGSESVMLLCNLAMLVGGVGREGVGVNPLRGQNNVQGAADMGCQPDAMTGYALPGDPDAAARFERVWGRPLPEEKGRTLPKMYDAIRAGEIRGLYILGEDVVQTDPNADLVVETLKKLDMLVVQELFLSETAKLAHVVLPGASFLEKHGTFTNGERRIQRIRPVLPPPGDAKPDWQILCDLMAATGYPQSFESSAEIMEEIAEVAPDKFGGVRFERLEPNGLQWPVPDLESEGTGVLHADSFPRGRGALACVPYVPSPAMDQADDELTLITGRVLEHYNTGSMTRRTPNAELVADDVLEIHPNDAAARGIEDGDRVKIASAQGEIETIAHVTDRVAPGTAFLSFHFPETGTNRLTSDVLDRLADCPEYKVTPIRVAPR